MQLGLLLICLLSDTITMKMEWSGNGVGTQIQQCRNWSSECPSSALMQAQRRACRCSADVPFKYCKEVTQVDIAIRISNDFGIETKAIGLHKICTYGGTFPFGLMTSYII